MPLTPPRPSPPPLNALRAFEAAVRHQSFQRAAEELAVTPGAVAQQVRKLEDWAGVVLFERRSQGVFPKALARDVLARLTAGFEELSAAARHLRQGSSHMPVRIAALPAVAQLWLAPRLTQLRTALPELEFSVHAMDNRPNLTHGDFDLTLYPDWSASEAAHVIALNRLAPVAAPNVANTISQLHDLRDVPLIHDSAWSQDWERWLNEVGVNGVDPTRGPVFSLYSLAVERCLAGDGILMGHIALLLPQIKNGTLVPLFPDLEIEGPPICLHLPRKNDVVGPGPLSMIAKTLTDLA